MVVTKKKKFFDSSGIKEISEAEFGKRFESSKQEFASRKRDFGASATPTDKPQGQPNQVEVDSTFVDPERAKLVEEKGGESQKKQGIIATAIEALNNIDSLGGLITPEQQNLARTAADFGPPIIPAVNPGAATAGLSTPIRQGPKALNTFEQFAGSKSFVTEASLVKKFPGITKNQLKALSQELGKQRVAQQAKEVLKQPNPWKKITIGGGAVLTAAVVANKFLEGAGLALWASTDNVMSQSGFYSSQLVDTVVFEGADPNEALRLLELQQDNMDAAREVVNSTSGLPYTRHYREAFTAAGDTSQAIMDLNKQRLLKKIQESQ